MGKFFNGKVKKDRGTLIKYGVIAAGIVLIILLFVLIAAGKNKNNNVVLTLKDTVTFEVNSEWPTAEDFFAEIENFDINEITFSDFDITTVGEYTVTITAGDQGSDEITVNVVDTTAPNLEIKDVTIPSGGVYEIVDFLVSCDDNSGDECILEYDSTSIDQNGNPIDFGSYTEDGQYTIKIVAKDPTGNITEAKAVKLLIGDGSSEQGPEGPKNPTVCQYGDLTINTDNHPYPVAVIVGDEINGCALNRDLWDSASVQTPVNNFYMDDYKRLESQLRDVLKAEYPNGAKIVAYPHYIAILNKDVTGLVGYAIEVNVYVADYESEGAIDKPENLLMSYYLRSDKTRDYSVNEYSIPE